MRLFVLVFAVASACTVNLDVPTDAQLRCKSSRDCPSGLLCKTNIGQCLPPGDEGNAPPSVVADSVVINRAAVTTGKELTVSFSVQGELFADPEVLLGTSPRVPFVLTQKSGNAFTFALTLTLPVSEGPAALLVSLVDTAGNEVNDITIGSPVLLDFTAPALTSFASTSAPLRAGSVGEVSFSVSEALAASPSVALVDGTALVRDETVLPPAYRYTYTVPTETSTPEDGEATVRLSFEDEAGNVFGPTDFDAFRIDVTAPTLEGTAEVLRPVARAGQLVGVTMTFSEPLASAPVVTLTEPVTSTVVTLGADVVIGATYTMSAELPGDAPDGTYEASLVSFADIAGNAGSGDVALGVVSVDSSAPELIVQPDVSPTRLSRQTGFDTCTVTFSINEDLGVNPSVVDVRIGDNPAACELSASETGFDYTCEYTVGELDPAGTQIVSVFLRDPAGNLSFGSAPPVTFDFDAPALAITAQLTRSDFFTRASLSSNELYLNRVSPTSGEVPEVVVNFTVAEPLVADPTFSLEGLTKMPASSGQFYSYTYTQPETPLADGTYELSATLVDTAGNEGTASLGTLHIDTQGPALTASQMNGVLYYRAPWGVDLAPSATYRLDVTTSFEPFSTVVVYTDADLALGIPVRVVNLDASGTTSTITLPAVNRPELYLALRDRAGNLHGTTALLLKKNRWHASLRGKQAGSLSPNPHRYEQTSRVDDTRTSWSRVTVEPNTSGALDAVGGGRQEVYGSAEDVFVLYDGYTYQPPDPAPAARMWPAFAYDAVSARHVLFGGIDMSTLFGDTWLWDGEAWSQGAGGPQSRYGAAAASYNGGSERGSVILFGGASLSNNYICETWRWDGASWFQLPYDTCIGPSGDSSHPSGRIDHAMTLDTNRNVVVMTGGSCSTGTSQYICSDMWLHEMVGGNPEPTWHASYGGSGGNAATRTRHSLAFDPVRDVIVSFGGERYFGAPDNELWEYEPGTPYENGTWHRRCVGYEADCAADPDCTCTQSPTARDGASMYYDPQRGGVVVAAGYKPGYPYAQYFSDAWLWDGTDWTKIHDDTQCSWNPPPGTPCFIGSGYVVPGAATSYDPKRHLAYLYGMYSSTGSPEDFFVALGAGESSRPAALATFEWSLANVSSSATIDSLVVRAYSGGTSGAQNGSELSVWDAANRSWVSRATGTAASSDPALVTATLTGATAEDALGEGELAVRVRPTTANEEGAAMISLDYIDVMIDYTLP